jgi:nitrogen regulatory protein PII
VVNPAYMVVAIVACAFVGYGAYLALSSVVSPRAPASGGELPGTVPPPRGRTESMHKIEVTLQPECLGGVSEALRKAKVGPFQASDVTIFDPMKGPEGSYRGAKYAIGRERVKLELIVQDHEMEPAVEAIRDGIDAFGEGFAELVVLVVQDSMHLRPSPWTRPRAIR